MPPASNQPVQCKTVALSEIDQQKDDFRITTREDVADLIKTIPHIGLITPPILIQHESEYTIVSGFRRIAACRELGWTEISARILDDRLEHHDCMRMAIADNALQRPLNLIETSRALSKLATFCDSLKQLAESASSCGLPDNQLIIKRIKDLCLLPVPIQNSIIKDTIPLTMANELATLDADFAVAIADVFEQLKLSLNKQKEIMTLISEIARREDISIGQVLEHETIQHVLNNEELDRVQKGRQFRDILRRWRYPRMVQAEKTYDAYVKNLKLDQDIQLIPPKDFEGPAYILKLNFNSPAHLKTLLNRANHLLQHPNFEKIFESTGSPQSG